VSEAKEKPAGKSATVSLCLLKRLRKTGFGRMTGFPFIVSQRLVEANHHAKHQSMNAASGSPPLP
jgi:hypothetical protein